MTQILSFDTISKSRRLTDVFFVIKVLPNEVGLTAEDCGVKPDEKVGLKYKPLTSSALAQILLNIKDLKAPHYSTAMNEGIIQDCLVEPAIPPGVAGSRLLQNWMPGTIMNVAGAIQTSSGYGEHQILTADEAVDDLGNSSTQTEPTTGTSQ